jgi:hypothetical protein
MITTAQLRRMIKIYLKHPRSVTQNELARHAGMAPQTFSDFILNKHNGITAEQTRKILDTIAPWKHDEICAAGRLRTSLLKQHYTKDEIAKIAAQMDSTGNESLKQHRTTTDAIKTNKTY